MKKDTIKRSLASGLVSLASLCAGCYNPHNKFETEKVSIYKRVEDPDGIKKVETYDNRGNLLDTFDLSKENYPTDYMVKLRSKFKEINIKVYDTNDNVSEMEFDRKSFPPPTN